MRRKLNLLIEPLLGSAGILLMGFATIPLVASAVGASISMTQGAALSCIFFLARWAWLAALRGYFGGRYG